MPSVQNWKLNTGTARVIPSSDKGILKPLIITADAGTGATDLDAFQARFYPPRTPSATRSAPVATT